MKVNDIHFSDTLLERPIGYEVDGSHFNLYPPTIGKNQMTGHLLKKIGFNAFIAQKNYIFELMRIYSSNPELCTRIIAINSLKGKKCLDNKKVETLMDYFGKHLSVEDGAQLLHLILQNDHVEEMISSVGLDKELEEYHRLQEGKENSSSYTFCGKTIYGTIIDPLCEKYGWTMEYILWGISYANIRLLLADSVKTVYLTEEEAKNVRPKNNKETLDVADPKNFDTILSMDWE